MTDAQIRGLDRQGRAAFQDFLQRQGYNTGGIDGLLGAKSNDSILKWRNATNRGADVKYGKMSAEQLASLKGNDAKTLQVYLNSKGYDTGGVDGIIGNKTLAAINSYRKSVDETNANNDLSLSGRAQSIGRGRVVYNPTPRLKVGNSGIKSSMPTNTGTISAIKRRL